MRALAIVVILAAIAFGPLTGPQASSQGEVQQAQDMLNRLGYDAGPADGVMGSRTRNAIRMFQVDEGLTVTGEVTAHLLSALEREVAERGAAVEQAPAAAPAQETSGEVQRFVDRLRALIDEAERSRAADRWLLDDLKELVADYDWPWRRQVLSLDLRQASDIQQAGVRVDAGRFAIDRHIGLVSEPAPVQSSAGSGKGSGEELAFAIGAAISASHASGPFSLGVYRDALDSPGYRLVIQPGTGGEIALVLVRPSGDLVVVASGKVPGDLADGRVHALEWTRDRAGRMSVSVDGDTVLSAQDTAVRDGFAGIILRNRGGDWALREVTVHDAG